MMHSGAAATGVFDPDGKTVVITTSGRLANGSFNLALHEIGHGYDFAARGLSDSAEQIANIFA